MKLTRTEALGSFSPFFFISDILAHMSNMDRNHSLRVLILIPLNDSANLILFNIMVIILDMPLQPNNWTFVLNNILHKNNAFGTCGSSRFT